MLGRLPEDLKNELSKYIHRIYFSQVLSEMKIKTTFLCCSVNMLAHRELWNDNAKVVYTIRHVLDDYYILYSYGSWDLGIKGQHYDPLLMKKELSKSIIPFRGKGMWFISIDMFLWTKGDVTKETVP
jgi:hypothetical protein